VMATMPRTDFCDLFQLIMISLIAVVAVH
jgi:hypothetical protein